MNLFLNDNFAEFNPLIIKSPNQAVLLLGSNAGDRIEMFEKAKQLLQVNDVMIIEQSAIYETEAWGLEDQPAFLNQVLKINTALTASELLQLLLNVENQMGRIRNKKWEQRCIDLDILFFNDEIINEEGLKIPHPHLHERRFTLIPLCDLMPELIHPLLKKTIKQLLDECEDKKEVGLI